MPSSNKLFADVDLENEVDKSAKVYSRNSDHNSKLMNSKDDDRSDESIREDVCQALYESRQVDASKMDIDVKNQIVYLDGQVEDRLMKRHAEDVVDKVRGVRDIQNYLTFIYTKPTNRRKLSHDQREFVSKMSN